jgi:hydroxyacylglutathione hydrolase
MKLDPKCIVYPAHGAGSPCGKNISSGTYDVLSNQLKTNYALKEISKADFITLATLDLPKPPQYFGHDVALNKGKATSVDEILSKSLVPKELPSLDEIKAHNIILLDTRTGKEFEAGFIPGSVSLPLSMNVAIWSGTMFKP